MKRTAQDLKAYEDRKKAEKRVQIYELLLPFVLYTEQRTIYEGLTRDKEVLEARIAELDVSNAPLEQLNK